MKKLICAVLLLALALSSLSALAVSRGDYLGDMRIYNCKEWVSLRQKPDNNSKRLAKVALGEIVTNCRYYSKTMVYCEYQGKKGYIFTTYLQPCAPKTCFSEVTPIAQDELVKNGEPVFQAENLNVYARHGYVNDGEITLLCAYQDDKTPLWGYMSRTQDATELELTGLFLGGTAEEPLLMLNNTELGLCALDPITGQQKWLLDKDTVELGASLVTAVDEAGTMYIAGYYGPDPVAVTAAGEVLWQSDVDDDNVFWPEEIRLEEKGIVVKYDSLPEGEADGYYEAGLSYEGEVLWIAIRS